MVDSGWKYNVNEQMFQIYRECLINHDYMNIHTYFVSVVYWPEGPDVCACGNYNYPELEMTVFDM